MELGAEVEREVRSVLRLHSAHLQLFWGFELYHREDLCFDLKAPRGAFNSYTAFRKRVEQLPVRPLETVSFGEGKGWEKGEELPELRDLSLGKV